MRKRLLSGLFFLVTGFTIHAPLSAQAPAATSEFTQRPVVLYTQPNRESKVVGTVVFTDELSRQSKPAAGTKAEEQWFTTQRPVAVSGYVHSRDMGKDLNIKEGAPVRRTPSVDSEIIFHWEKGMEPDFGRVMGYFTQVSTQRNVPAYYQALPAPVAQPKPQAAQRVAPAPLPKAPAPAPVSPKGDGQPITPPITTYRLLTELPENPEETRYFEGTFRPYRSILQLRRNYRFEVMGSDGQRIAFVDMDNVVSNETLDRYFRKKVLITGTIFRIAHTNDYVIKARQIRAREN